MTIDQLKAVIKAKQRLQERICERNENLPYHPDPKDVKIASLERQLIQNQQLFVDAQLSSQITDAEREIYDDLIVRLLDTLFVHGIKFKFTDQEKEFLFDFRYWLANLEVE